MRLLPVGRWAVMIEVDRAEQVPAVYAQVRALAGEGALGQQPRDIVPAARTVLVDGVDPDQAQPVLVTIDPSRSVTAQPGTAPEVHVVPVAYDGEDLALVAQQWDCTVRQLVDRHVDTVFTVAFCGFAPGFPYLLGDPPLPVVRRRDRPRTRVPAGAVGLGSEYCGIYPREMPGGWLLIGRTGRTLFDPDRDPPALLRPGDRVRFEVSV